MNQKSYLKILSEKPKVKQVLENLQKDEFKIILLARLSPVLPFAVTNVLFSFSGKTSLQRSHT